MKSLINNILFKIESCFPEDVSMTTTQDQFFIYFHGKLSKKTHFYLQKEIDEPIVEPTPLSAIEKIHLQELLFPIKYVDALPEREALLARQRVDYMVMEMEQGRELEEMKTNSILNNRHLENTLKIA